MKLLVDWESIVFRFAWINFSFCCSVQCVNTRLVYFVFNFILPRKCVPKHLFQYINISLVHNRNWAKRQVVHRRHRPHSKSHPMLKYTVNMVTSTSQPTKMGKTKLNSITRAAINLKRLHCNILYINILNSKFMHL